MQYLGLEVLPPLPMDASYWWTSWILLWLLGCLPPEKLFPKRVCSCLRMDWCTHSHSFHWGGNHGSWSIWVLGGTAKISTSTPDNLSLKGSSSLLSWHNISISHGHGVHGKWTCLYRFNGLVYCAGTLYSKVVGYHAFYDWWPPCEISTNGKTHIKIKGAKSVDKHWIKNYLHNHFIWLVDNMEIVVELTVTDVTLSNLEVTAKCLYSLWQCVPISSWEYIENLTLT